MAREKACPHSPRSLKALATELKVIAVVIEQIADKYSENLLEGPILIENQTSVDRALIELNKFKNKAKVQLDDKLDEKRVATEVHGARPTDCS